MTSSFSAVLSLAQPDRGLRFNSSSEAVTTLEPRGSVSVGRCPHRQTGSPGGQMHAVQEECLARNVFQCGFCAPGMILAAAALLERNPEPTKKEVREALAGNLCRCTGYEPIVEAVLAAAKRRQASKVEGQKSKARGRKG